MPAEQLVLLPIEEPSHPTPLPLQNSVEVVRCMADLLLQVATSNPVVVAVEEVNDEVLR